MEWQHLFRETDNREPFLINPTEPEQAKGPGVVACVAAGRLCRVDQSGLH